MEMQFLNHIFLFFFNQNISAFFFIYLLVARIPVSILMRIVTELIYRIQSH